MSASRPRSQPKPPMNLANLLLDHPFPDGEGLLFTVDSTTTAGEARAAARQVAERLGPLEGRAVAVQLPNGPDLVSTMAGVWLAGGDAVPLPPPQLGPEAVGIK